MQIQTQTPIKDTLYDRLFQSADKKQIGTKIKVTPFHEWVKESKITVEGRPFNYEKREYLKPVYRDDHAFTVHMKASQGGFTLWAMLRTIYKSRFKNIRGALYLFPSRTDVSDFAKGRVDPLIDENPDNIGQWIRDTDATNIKKIWNSFLYLRGMKSRVGLKSIPVDLVVFDELDEAHQSMIDMAMERMAASDDGGEVIMLSNPTLPDYGIDKVFQSTDENFWLLKCSRCNEWHNLVDEFPGCFVTKRNGDVIRACVKCGKELNPARGQYVAKRPDITDKRGYHYSQLYSQFPASSPDKILHQFKTTNNMREFYNLKIGVPYVEAENRLSIEEILALCGDEGIASSDPGPCSMGVDQNKGLHVVIGKDTNVNSLQISEVMKLTAARGERLSVNGKIIHLGIYKDWEELDGLMKNFNVSRCVVDAMPEMRNARAFASRFPGRIFLCYYRDFQKGNYKWNEEDLTVSCNRTESLDASHREIQLANIILPKECDIVKTFANHLHNVAKKIEEDEDSGSKRYVYVKLGEDHFRHAQNYEVMARQYTLDLAFPWMQ
jgi:hypothetical protein